MNREITLISFQKFDSGNVKYLMASERVYLVWHMQIP
jgi:hypothetical protein